MTGQAKHWLSPSAPLMVGQLPLLSGELQIGFPHRQKIVLTSKMNAFN
jgi:hypothetical protein